MQALVANKPGEGAVPAMQESLAERWKKVWITFGDDSNRGQVLAGYSTSMPVSFIWGAGYAMPNMFSPPSATARPRELKLAALVERLVRHG